MSNESKNRDVVDVEIFQYREMLFGRVLHQDKQALGDVIIDHEGYVLSSDEDSPDIIENCLYVQGRNSELDDYTFSYHYDSEEAAVTAAVGFSKLVDHVNNAVAPSSKRSVRANITQML
jgi:hypothetical protein